MRLQRADASDRDRFDQFIKTRLSNSGMVDSERVSAAQVCASEEALLVLCACVCLRAGRAACVRAPLLFLPISSPRACHLVDCLPATW